jgi:hypothetical protein
MRIFVFKKVGFKDRQSEKLKDANTRQAILINTSIVNDPKMLMLHEQRDYTLFALYIHILGKLDLETETWEVREDEMKSWFFSTFKVSNRFDFMSRIQWLNNAGLIDFYCPSNETLTDSYSVSNDVLTSSYSVPNEVLTPLETVENLAALRATKDNKTNQTKKEKEELLSDFNEWYEAYPRKDARKRAEKAYELARKKVGKEELLESVQRYIKTKPAYADWKMPSAWLNDERWTDQGSIPQTTSVDAAGIPAHFTEQEKWMYRMAKRAEERELQQGTM